MRKRGRYSPRVWGRIIFRSEAFVPTLCISVTTFMFIAWDPTARIGFIFGGREDLTLFVCCACLILAFVAIIVREFQRIHETSKSVRFWNAALIHVPLVLLSMMLWCSIVVAMNGLLNTQTHKVYYSKWISLYFVVTTWTSVGLGDYVPFTPWGRTWTAVVALIGQAVSAIYIGLVLYGAGELGKSAKIEASQRRSDGVSEE